MGQSHTIIRTSALLPSGSITKIGGKNAPEKALCCCLGNVIPEHIKVTDREGILYNGVDWADKVSDIFHTISFQWDGPFFFFPTLESELAFHWKTREKYAAISDKLEDFGEV
jgi:hypothetical protein